nr:DUF4214 domain-containing protein [Maliibacterium massiliense]
MRSKSILALVLSAALILGALPAGAAWAQDAQADIMQITDSHAPVLEAAAGSALQLVGQVVMHTQQGSAVARWEYSRDQGASWTRVDSNQVSINPPQVGVQVPVTASLRSVPAALHGAIYRLRVTYTDANAQQVFEGPAHVLRVLGNTAVIYQPIALPFEGAGNITATSAVDGAGAYVDGYAFALAKGQCVQLDMTGDIEGAHLRLMDAAGNPLLAKDADAGVVSMTYTAPQAGTYLLACGSASAGKTGSYRLRIGDKRAEVTYPQTALPLEETIALDASVQDASGRYARGYTVALAFGDTLHIQTNVPLGMAIYDADGTCIASADQAQSLQRCVLAAGTYRVLLTAGAATQAALRMARTPMRQDIQQQLTLPAQTQWTMDARHQVALGDAQGFLQSFSFTAKAMHVLQGTLRGDGVSGGAFYLFDPDGADVSGALVCAAASGQVRVSALLQKAGAYKLVYIGAQADAACALALDAPPPLALTTNLSDDSTLAQGETLRVLMRGVGMDNAAPVQDDVRYLPVSWAIGDKSGTFAQDRYALDASGLALGAHTLRLTFALQRYDGGMWVTQSGARYTYDACAFTVTQKAPVQYAITVTQAQHGTITPEGTHQVNEGGSLNVTFVPDASYELYKVLLDGQLVDAQNNRYTLADVRENHTVSAIFRPIVGEDTLLVGDAAAGGAHASVQAALDSLQGAHTGALSIVLVSDTAWQDDDLVVVPDDRGITSLTIRTLEQGATYQVGGPDAHFYANGVPVHWLGGVIASLHGGGREAGNQARQIHVSGGRITRLLDCAGQNLLLDGGSVQRLQIGGACQTTIAGKVKIAGEIIGSDAATLLLQDVGTADAPCDIARLQGFARVALQRTYLRITQAGSAVGDLDLPAQSSLQHPATGTLQIGNLTGGGTLYLGRNAVLACGRAGLFVSGRTAIVAPDAASATVLVKPRCQNGGLPPFAAGNFSLEGSALGLALDAQQQVRVCAAGQASQGVHTLHVRVQGGGSVAGVRQNSSITVDHNATWRVPFIADSGQMVTSVKVDGRAVIPARYDTAWPFANIAQDHTLEVTFAARRDYRVNIQSNFGGTAALLVSGDMSGVNAQNTSAIAPASYAGVICRIVPASGWALDTIRSNGAAAAPLRDGVDSTLYYFTLGGNTTLDVQFKPASMAAKREAFVRRLYQAVLNRTPSQQEVDNWCGDLASGKETGATIVKGFIFSDEYLQQNTSDAQYVDMLYHVILDRAPDPVGGSGWKQDLAGGLSRYYVMCGFVHATEYRQLCQSYGITAGTLSLFEPRDVHPQLAKFVGRFYQYFLDRSSDSVGINHWVNLLSSHGASGSDIVMGFIESREFEAHRFSDDTYVQRLYRALLDRQADPVGLADWTNRLRTQNRRSIALGFIGSYEFQDICQRYGIRRQ